MDSSTHRKSPMRQPPAHLSEFYSYVNGNSNTDPNTLELQSQSQSQSQQHTSANTSKYTKAASSSSAPLFSSSSTQRTESFGSSSPFFDPTRRYSSLMSQDESVRSGLSSISPSALDLEVLITKRDIDETKTSYNDLLKTAANYREALVTLSTAASDFGRALEDSARCKGSGRASDGLMTASGLHYLIANHQLILSQSLQTNFEKPVSNIVNQFDKDYKQNDINFKSLIKDKVKQLKQNEKANLKFSKKKTRNIISYKSNLLQLASQLDEIDRLKHDYYVSSFDTVQDSAVKILSKASSIISVETTIYENIAKKAWTGGGLDDLLDTYVHNDPFQEDDDSHEEETIREGDNDDDNANEDEYPAQVDDKPINPHTILSGITEGPNESEEHLNKSPISRDSNRKSILDTTTSTTNNNGSSSILGDIDNLADDSFYAPPITASKLGSSHNSSANSYTASHTLPNAVNTIGALELFQTSTTNNSEKTTNSLNKKTSFLNINNLAISSTANEDDSFSLPAATTPPVPIVPPSQEIPNNQ